MNKKRMIITLAASGVVLGAVFGAVQLRSYMIKQYFATLPKPVVTVTVATADVLDWRAATQAVGALRAVNGVDISATVSGQVRDIAFQSGQAVRKGQMLVRLDTDVEQTDLQSALADADLARISAVRQRTLIKSDTVSQSAVDKAEAELKVKHARVDGIRATIEKKTVEAPFAGVLGVRKVDLGQYVQPGQAIVNLQDLSVMLADFTISQKELGSVKVGDPIRLTTDAWPDTGFDGTVSVLEPQVDSRTGMLSAQARIPNAGGALRPGMFVRVEVLRQDNVQVVAVPVSAVTYNLHGDSIFVVQDGADGKKQVVRTFVTLGDRRDGKVAVTKGVKAGDVVVTSGQVKLENGSLVDIRTDLDLQQQAAR